MPPLDVRSCIILRIRIDPASMLPLGARLLGAKQCGGAECRAARRGGLCARSGLNNGTALFMGGDDGSYYLLNASALGGANASPLGFIPADPTLATGAGGLYR
jgi:hypothetical protein